MKEAIISNLDNPVELEQLYQDNKTTFKTAFNAVYPDIKEKTVAQVWHARLNFDTTDISWGTGKELLFVIIASLLAGLIAKIPEFAGLSEEYFYPRNLSFIVFPFLTAYFAWKQKTPTRQIIIVSVVMLVSAIYINMLPDNPGSDTLILACIHLPLLLWAATGFTFTGNHPTDYQRRLDYLRFNGDLVVMTTILMIAGALLTGITLGLFKIIDIEIETFYFKYIAVWGASAAPIAGTYLVRTNPQLVNKVSPVIAKVFTPLVLVMLVVYLGAVIYTGKDPYNDREFLMLFNGLLIGVMAIILFSVAENTKQPGNKWAPVLLSCLSIITVIINGIALSAIIFRIAEWGITPNRLAVLGSNLLILANLVIVTYKLVQSARNSNASAGVEKSIAAFLPVYVIWTIVVTFLFPVLFNFK